MSFLRGFNAELENALQGLVDEKKDLRGIVKMVRSLGVRERPCGWVRVFNEYSLTRGSGL